jgi:hypothetical protein
MRIRWFRKILSSQIILLMFGCFFIGSLAPTTKATCVQIQPREFRCSDSETKCEQQIILYDCGSAVDVSCCTFNGTFTFCCGLGYQNARNDFPCGDSHCSTGGLIVDPISGKFTTACFGSVKSASQELPRGNGGSSGGSKSSGSDRKAVSSTKTEKPAKR